MENRELINDFLAHDVDIDEEPIMEICSHMSYFVNFLGNKETHCKM